jgi:ABC-type transporter Mla MlaB component
MSQPTLRITLNQKEEAATLTLEGRVAGPWSIELGRVWIDTAPRLTQKILSIDISNVTFVDADGMKVLRDIYSQAPAEIVANTPWTRHLAVQISAKTLEHPDQEQ